MKLLPCISLLALGFTATGQVFTRGGLLPQFLTPVTYLVPGVASIALADINGDGIIDVVTANGFAPDAFMPGGHGVSVLLGNGDGTFQPARAVLATGNPNSVVVGDFNNDGKADIVIANDANTTKLNLLLGNGDGTFQAPIATDVGGVTDALGLLYRGAISLVAADFDGDGKLDLAVTGLDLAVANSGVTGKVLLNNGDGTFRISYTFGAGRVQAGDFNGDGKQDLLTSGAGPASILLGNGDGTFRTGQLNVTPGGPAIVGDFNGDGIVDVASVSSPGGRARYLNYWMTFGSPSGIFKPAILSNFQIFDFATAASNGDHSVSADFDGDGKLDIAGAHFVSYGTGDGLFGPFGNTVNVGATGPTFSTQNPNSVPAPFVVVGDLDGNGSPDIVTSTSGNLILVALNTSGHPPLLAKLNLIEISSTGVAVRLATSVVGGVTAITGEVWIGGPAPAGGVVVTLTSGNPAAFFPGGSTVTIPAGSQAAAFSLSTAAVTASTPVTISASSHLVTVTGIITVVPQVALTSVSIDQTSLFGFFGGNPAVGTVTLSGPAPAGLVVSLASANPAVVSVPATVTVPAGATTATFPIKALPAPADSPVAVSASLQGATLSATVTVKKNTPTVVITKASYDNALGVRYPFNIEATVTDGGLTVQVFDAITGAFAGQLTSAGSGKFIGRFSGPRITSAAVQSSGGGMTTAPVAQK